MAKFVRRALGNSPFRINSFNPNLNPRGTQNSRFRQPRRYCYNMCKSKDCPPIKVRFASTADFDNIVSFMKDVFFKHDPACVYLGIPDPPHHALLGDLYENLKTGMTLLAVEENHCIVGAVINTGLSLEDAIRAEQLANCCLPRPEQDLMKFYTHVTRQSKIFEKYCVKKIFDIAYLAVEPEWQQMGISKKLVEASWHLARDCTFDIFRFDCTNSNSAKMAEKFGWKCIYTLPYERFVLNNEQVFKNVKEPHLELKVYIDLLKMYEDVTLHYGDDSKKQKKKKKRKKK